MSLGGVRDEQKSAGTGAPNRPPPGKIMTQLKRAGVNNPSYARQVDKMTPITGAIRPARSEDLGSGTNPRHFPEP
jgi:ATP-dependent Lon protease